jgi:hypothetical protein
MSGQGATTGSNMVDIDLDKDDGHQEKNQHDKNEIDEKKETAMVVAPRPRKYADATRTTRLLPATGHATAMGRHVIDWSSNSSSNDAKQSLILLEWPGVQFTFRVTGTTLIAVRLQTGGAAFGYRILQVVQISSYLGSSAHLLRSEQCEC